MTGEHRPVLEKTARLRADLESIGTPEHVEEIARRAMHDVHERVKSTIHDTADDVTRAAELARERAHMRTGETVHAATEEVERPKGVRAMWEKAKEKMKKVKNVVTGAKDKVVEAGKEAREEIEEDIEQVKEGPYQC